LGRFQSRLDPGMCVKLDWFGDLPDVASQVFQSCMQELESSYLMFSVSLNEAIGLHRGNYLKKSFEVIAVSSSLCRRLTRQLEDILHSVSAHCVEQGTNPSLAPLNITDFIGDRSQLLALKSLVRHGTLVRRAAQFQNKIRTVRIIVTRATHDFCASSDLLAAEGVLADAPLLWTAMDQGHFDLNTCLRESFILLKCFLRVLPADELRTFQDAVRRCKACEPQLKAKATAAGRVAALRATS
jgi:hypothetical protein